MTNYVLEVRQPDTSSKTIVFTQDPTKEGLQKFLEDWVNDSFKGVDVDLSPYIDDIYNYKLVSIDIPPLVFTFREAYHVETGKVNFKIHRNGHLVTKLPLHDQILNRGRRFQVTTTKGQTHTVYDYDRDLNLWDYSHFVLIAWETLGKPDPWEDVHIGDFVKVELPNTNLVGTVKKSPTGARAVESFYPESGTFSTYTFINRMPTKVTLLASSEGEINGNQ